MPVSVEHAILVCGVTDNIIFENCCIFVVYFKTVVLKWNGAHRDLAVQVSYSYPSSSMQSVFKTWVMEVDSLAGKAGVWGARTE